MPRFLTTTEAVGLIHNNVISWTPCEVCCSNNARAVLVDERKPSEVRWFCPKHGRAYIAFLVKKDQEEAFKAICDHYYGEYLRSERAAKIKAGAQ